MFSRMKNFLKEKAPGSPDVSLSDLHVGCTLGFGFMPQQNISGRRLPVTEVSSYLFDADSFVAYRLEGENTDVNLIVAESGDGADAYLALSCRLEEKTLPALFGSVMPPSWFNLAKGQGVEVATRAAASLKGWLAPHYRLAMATHGRLLEGDFRMRKPAGRLNLSRPFEYALLVDEDNTHALEAERYDDGTLRAFATVYRPVTDIGEIARIGLVRSNLTLPANPVITLPPMPPSPALIDEKEAQEQESEEQEASNGKLHRFVEAAQADVTPVHGKFGRLQPSAAAPQTMAMSHMLACDIRLAGRIIDEAQQNQMQLCELVRKVIDLPARMNDQVLIPFTLSDAEYAELARRYQLPATDKEGVKEQVLEELRAFVGEKKR